jgi:hypothetical protein
MDKRALSGELNFFLKQVDPVAVAKRYLAGTLKICTDKIKFETVDITPDLEVGTSPESEVYEIKDKNGELIRVITGGHQSWLNQDALAKFNCWHCRVEHTGRYISLPVKVDRDPSKGLIFYGTGTYCCFECAYADLKTKWYCGVYQREYLYVDSEYLLRYMYHQLTGKSELIASPAWYLHQKNGGPLPDRDFYSSKSTYVEVPGIIIRIAKNIYTQSNK